MRRREVILLETKTQRVCWTAEHLLHSVQLALGQPPGDNLLWDSRDLSSIRTVRTWKNSQRFASVLPDSGLVSQHSSETSHSETASVGTPVYPIASILSSESLPNIGKKLQTGRCLCVADEGFLNLLNPFEGGAKTLHQEPVPSREEPQSRGEVFSQKDSQNDTIGFNSSASILVWKFFDFLWLGFQAA